MNARGERVSVEGPESRGHAIAIENSPTRLKIFRTWGAA
jgi:hypothetical protein